jgi:hypothetical protein
MTEKKTSFWELGAFPHKIAKFRKSENVSPISSEYDKITSTAEGKRLYGDSKTGATLEQGWRNNRKLSGAWPVCLLVSGKPTGPTGAINHIVKMDSQQLADTLAEIFELYASDLCFSGAAVLYDDGYRGHAIRVVKYDNTTSRFAYIDSWPGNSLLSKEFNAAGIDAQRADFLSLGLPDIERTYWTVTLEELKKVIVAAFISPPIWSGYLGEHYITYNEFQNSNFWSWFDIKEKNVEKMSNDFALITLQCGSAQSDIDFHIKVNQKMQLVEGRLNLPRSWVGKPYNFNAYALDIIRSFFSTLIPAPDKQHILQLLNFLNLSALMKVLRNTQNPEYAEKVISGGTEQIKLHEALYAFVGASPSFFRPFVYSDIKISNSKKEGQEWLETSIVIYAF